MIEKIDGKGVQQFTYDAFDRLTCAKLPGCLIKYQYDADGRFLTKEVTKEEKTTTTEFLYQFDTEIGAANANHQIHQLRILSNGEGTGSTVAIELDQKPYAVIDDHRGNIRCLVDLEKKSIEQTYRYSAFGEQQIFGNSTLENPWGFANKRKDQDTGHIHFLNRVYIPDLGRWLTTDPLGFADGLNLYAYVRNNPLTYIDPDGQMVFVIPLIAFGASIVFPSLSTIAYSAATCAVVWGGYQLGQKYDVNSAVFGLLSNIMFNKPGNIYNSKREPSPIPYPGNDPNICPGEGYEWRGRGDPASGRGSWVNEETGWRLHPDLDSGTHGSHWDSIGGEGKYEGKEGRIYPDGTYEVKN